VGLIQRVVEAANMAAMQQTGAITIADAFDSKSQRSGVIATLERFAADRRKFGRHVETCANLYALPEG